MEPRWGWELSYEIGSRINAADVSQMWSFLNQIMRDPNGDIERRNEVGPSHLALSEKNRMRGCQVASVAGWGLAKFKSSSTEQTGLRVGAVLNSTDAAVLLPTQLPWVRFSKNYFNVDNIYWLRWLEESGQRLKKVYETHLVLASTTKKQDTEFLNQQWKVLWLPSLIWTIQWQCFNYATYLSALMKTAFLIPTPT